MKNLQRPSGVFFLLLASATVSTSCLAEVKSSCLSIAAGKYKPTNGSYFLAPSFVGAGSLSPQETSDFYRKALMPQGFNEITSCGNVTKPSDVAKHRENFQPPACDRGWPGPRRFILYKFAPVNSRAEFDAVARQACRLETLNIKMVEFRLMVVNPRPPVVSGIPSSALKHQG
jgi:hypothetical protein